MKYLYTGYHLKYITQRQEKKGFDMKGHLKLPMYFIYIVYNLKVYLRKCLPQLM